MADKKSDLRSRELLVLADRKSNNKEGSGWKMRVVQYYKPGESISVKLEVGEYWKGDDGIVRFKAKGLADRDFDELEKTDAETGKPIYSTVRKLIKSPPPLPADSEPDNEPSDSVPFS